ncbi:NADH-quinone oxidoreductase subunit I [anaerobic digester metagenome]
MEDKKDRPGLLREVLDGASGLVGSYAATLTHLFRKPVTEQYPDYKRPMPARTRGRIILTRSPDGNERCVACYLCSGACPVNCISMQSEEGTDGRRRAAWFRINFARCIYCGLCEEACPTLAIQLTPEFAFCKDAIEDFVYEKEDLLVDHGGKNAEYDFYAHAGVAAGRPKGEHIGEDEPVDVKSILP